ncbi:MAG: type II toxin-antitoxin system prevent-host-death family antitoxin [Deltaproteobacteria bacterium]|nr:type II toxin-antitoxin system prevent-host-death family antitoxin [Deltaproteobacteria bacterium]
MPRMMTAAAFKAHCLQAMEEVAATGDPIVVTKRGKPMAQLVAIGKKPKTLRGFLKGRVRARRDIVGPLGISWNAARSLSFSTRTF